MHNVNLEYGGRRCGFDTQHRSISLVAARELEATAQGFGRRGGESGFCFGAGVFVARLFSRGVQQSLQGYLARKKQHRPRTLQQGYA